MMEVDGFVQGKVAPEDGWNFKLDSLGPSGDFKNHSNEFVPQPYEP